MAQQRLEELRAAVRAARTPGRRASLERELSLLEKEAEPDPLAEVQKRVDALLVEREDWARTVYREGWIRKAEAFACTSPDKMDSVRWARLREVYTSAYAQWDEEKPELARLIAEHGIRTGGREAYCWECQVEAGRVEYSHEAVRRFVAAHPEAALCAWHGRAVVLPRSEATVRNSFSTLPSGR